MVLRNTVRDAAEIPGTKLAVNIKQFSGTKIKTEAVLAFPSGVVYLSARVPLQSLTLLAPLSRMWGQSTQTISGFSPKRDWGPRKVNLP